MKSLRVEVVYITSCFTEEDVGVGEVVLSISAGGLLNLNVNTYLNAGHLQS